MLVYAHRAGRGLASENTLYACQKVLQYPIDFIDLDIGMTKDGLLVATHDKNLNCDITRDARGKYITDSIPVHSLTHQELSTYNVGKINPESKYASFFPDQQSIPHAKIPLLQEAIDYVQSVVKGGVSFQIEMKM